MRLVSFRTDPDRPAQAGLRIDDRVHPVVGLLRVAQRDLNVPIPPQLAGMRGVPMELVLSFWTHAEPGLRAAVDHLSRQEPGERDGGVPLAEVELTSPVTDPPTLRDFYAFEEHVRRARSRRGLEVAKEWYEVPVFYFSHPGVLHGPDARVPKPASTEALDFELEVAWVVGRRGTDVAVEDATDHIVGLTILNDLSARDVQAHEMAVGLGPSKGKDFASGLGPEIVTLDELEVHRRGQHWELPMEARINGETVSQGNLGDLHWTIPQMTAHASRDSVIQPGDVMGTGTVGTGSILDLGTDEWLQVGDVVELEVGELGVLRSEIV